MYINCMYTKVYTYLAKILTRPYSDVATSDNCASSLRLHAIKHGALFLDTAQTATSAALQNGTHF